MKSLREKVDPSRDTTQKAVAQSLGFSPQFLSDVLANRRGMTDGLANSLGFKRVEYYIKKKPEASW